MGIGRSTGTAGLATAGSGTAIISESFSPSGSLAIHQAPPRISSISPAENITHFANREPFVFMPTMNAFFHLTQGSVATVLVSFSPPLQVSLSRRL